MPPKSWTFVKPLRSSIRFAIALRLPLRQYTTTAAAQTVHDELVALVAELVHPAHELLYRDANGAVDVLSRKLLRASNVEKRCTVRDELARLASRNSDRGETQVEHGRNDDDQDD